MPQPVKRTRLYRAVCDLALPHAPEVALTAFARWPGVLRSLSLRTVAPRPMLHRAFTACDLVKIGYVRACKDSPTQLRQKLRKFRINRDRVGQAQKVSPIVNQLKVGKMANTTGDGFGMIW